MAKKQGDLRLLKNGVVFGPTDREGLQRLLAAGRVGPADLVSVLNAEWMTIADFLADAPPNEKPPAADSVASQSRTTKGDLRVLSGGRVVGSLSRGEVEQLRSSGRVDDDDLIGALDGPWMRVGDFFGSLSTPTEDVPETLSPAATVFDDVDIDQLLTGPRAEPAPAVVTPSAPSQAGAPTAEMEPLEAEVIETPAPTPRVTPPPLPLKARLASRPTMPPPVPAARPPLVAPVVLQPTAPQQAGSYRVIQQRPPAPPGVRPAWHINIRGMYSAPLQKYHVKALYEAREVTLDCLARHSTWHDSDWRPIRSIPELADIAGGAG